MLLGSPQALAQTTQFSGQNWQIMEDGFGDELHFEGGTNGNGAFYIIDDATLGSTRVEANKYCDLGAANCVTAAQMANAVGSIIASLNDINDVVITGTPADNEVLAYDTSTSKWINQTATEAGIDGSTTNEIQTLSLSSNTLSLSVGGGSANLASYLDNTDTQDLSLSGTTLSLVGSPSVDLSGLSDGYAPASGSSGAVQFSAGSGVFSADANKLFWDNSTKQLGIGSSAPSEILEIEGAANLTGSDPVRIQVTNSTSGNWTADAEVMGLDFYSNDTSITSGQSAGRIALRTNVGSTDGANFAMAFSVHGSQALNEAMRIDKDAQVGIGLTNPTEKLHIGGNILVTTGNDVCIAGGNCLSTAGGATSIDGLSDGKVINSSIFLGQLAGEYATGSDNVAIGDYAFDATSATGGYNTALGKWSLTANTTGQQNVAIGHTAMGANTIGGNNTAVGANSLDSNIDGNYNTAMGYWSLDKNTSGTSNTGIGVWSMVGNLTGSENTALGYHSLGANTSGTKNTAIGNFAMNHNSTGDNNTAVGYAAGNSTALPNNPYNNNSFFGYRAGGVITTGSNNTFIGYQAGDTVTTGGSNILIGYNVDTTAANSNHLNIGNTIYGNLSTGNVGIGVSNPTSAKLEVNGDLKINETVFFDGEVAVSGSTVDWGTGNRQVLTLSSTISLLNFTDPPGPASLVLSIIHNGTATITAWDSEIRWSGGSAPTLTGTSGYVDIISCVYRSAPSSRYFCSPMLNFDPS